MTMREMAALMRLMLVPACLLAGLGGCGGGEGRKAEAESSAASSGEERSEEAQHIATIPVLVRHGDGAADTKLSVELALTPEQQEKGLMHRTDLKQGDGMLFPMLPPRNPSFWMKGTPVRLDLVFIRPDGGIAKIVAKAKPNDPTPLFADVPVAGVLELRGGDAASFGIDEGDRVSWGACTETGAGTSVKVDNFCPAA